MFFSLISDTRKKHVSLGTIPRRAQQAIQEASRRDAEDLRKDGAADDRGKTEEQRAGTEVLRPNVEPARPAHTNGRRAEDPNGRTG